MDTLKQIDISYIKTHKYKIIGVILVLVLLGGFIYYKFIRKDYTSLFKEAILLNNNYSKFVSHLYLPESDDGRRFTYTFWIKFRNIPENAGVLKTIFTEPKNIMNRNNSPKITYNIYSNILIFTVQYKNDDALVNYNLEVEDLPIQRWTHIAYVLDNRNINVFIDGKLHKSGFIPSVPFLFNKNLNIGEIGETENFNGYLSDGRYYNKALNYDKIESISNEKNLLTLDSK